MRMCPTCSFELKESNYHFCPQCLSELPGNLVKTPKVHLLNVKLDFKLIPEEKFLFITVPYENRFSLKIIKFLFYLVIVASLVLIIFYNFRYGF